MNKDYISKVSQSDMDRVDKMRQDEIDLTDIPEITEEQMSKARLRLAGEPISMGKVRVNILLDAKIVAYFKAQAGGRGYQTLINEALKNIVQQQDLEIVLRRIIREELKAAG